jgi:integrase
MRPGKRRPSAAKIKGGTFASVIRAYMASPKFSALAKSTRVNYGRTLEIAERAETIGSVTVDEMRPAVVQAFLDGFADRPAQQKCVQTAIKAVERWAIVRDLLPRPITLGTEAPGGDGGHEPWPDHLVEIAERHARPDLARVVTIAANTGQRGSDIVRMRWSDIEDQDGHPGINVTQQKTCLRLWVPFTAALRAVIPTWEKRPPFFLVLRPDGVPFTRPQLSDDWWEERERNPALAPLKAFGAVLHGLRGTAAVRLYRAGATTLEGSKMIGMSEQMFIRYVRLVAQRKMALAAVHRLDGTAREPTPFVRPKNNSVSD